MSSFANLHRFNNQVALVTGGTSGIGRAAAIAFAREGAKVVVAGRRTAEGNATVKTITDAGGEAIFIKTDVANEEEVSALIAQTLARFHRLDVAFNNAGVEGTLGPIAGQTVENYHHVFDANVKGVFLSLKHEIPAMLRTGGGSIINTSSIGGSIGFANFSLYVASKHAVIGLTKSAALEYASQRIRVNAISPAAIQTDMLDRAFGTGESDNKKLMASHHPVGRIGTPEETADAVLYLAAPGASFVTGHDLLVDGGFTAQ